MRFKAIDADGLRSLYIDFFVERGHVRIPSASIVPQDDASVLFTTAGMHPLVPYLLGAEHPAGDKLVNYQKCVRTTDIEEVGNTTHLTFFEMLGNWSLGAYFKQESLAWSVEFLTKPEYLNVPLDSMWATVFAGNGAPRDEEAAEIWRGLGMPEERILFLGEEHNWWAAGPVGPCGPDSEIFIDTTGSPCEQGDDCLPGVCSCGRWFEVWNNVFMTFERHADGSLVPLPKRNVDTGMGLERTLAVLNGVPSVYDIGPLRDISESIAKLAGSTPEDLAVDPEALRSLRILTDHLRTSVFMLGDESSVRPRNQGRGYVLRRLIRRAVRHCGELGVDADSWVGVADAATRTYQRAYPELVDASETIQTELAREVSQFQRTLTRGMAKVEKEIARLKEAGETQLPGDFAFHLYDTDGFPLEFTEEVAHESGMTVDTDEFDRRFAEHRDISRTTRATSGLADESPESIRYHTATHLLHAALRNVLGDHVFQKGSHITSERLRFDFSHPEATTKEQLAEIQSLVQSYIDAGMDVERLVMSQDEARKLGAIGLFDDKYSGDVSVYRIDDVSLEFCAGPHVSNTSELGHFEIAKEQSSGAGVRRIRAVLT